MDFADFEFESVLLDMGIGEGRTDTVFAYLERMNTKGLHDGQHRRGGVAIALELYNDQVRKSVRDAGLEVLPDECGIDGESFGLTSVDEGDSFKGGAQARLKRRPIVPTTLLHESANFF